MLTKAANEYQKQLGSIMDDVRVSILLDVSHDGLSSSPWIYPHLLNLIFAWQCIGFWVSVDTTIFAWLVSFMRFCDVSRLPFCALCVRACMLDGLVLGDGCQWTLLLLEDLLAAVFVLTWLLICTPTLCCKNRCKHLSNYNMQQRHNIGNYH